MEASDAKGDVCVLAPSPLYTVTIEERGDGTPEVHFHAGGQGLWVARMARVLGAETTLCGPIGGESGIVIQSLIERSGPAFVPLPSLAANGGYVHDRRSGEREPIVEIDAPVLQRHEVDELSALVLTLAMSHRALVLTGPSNPAALPAATIERLAKNAAAVGCRVVADLSGEFLKTVSGGVEVLKVAHNEVLDAGLAKGDSRDDLLAAARELRGRGIAVVIVSRGGDPAIAATEDGAFEIHLPELDAADHRGAGDSMTAAAAVALARGLDAPSLLRLAAAAGAMNVTRHGLGSGRRDLVDKLVEQVSLREL
jgi:1-phosphofructokinase